MSHATTLEVFARDASGANKFRASEVPMTSTVAEFMKTMLGRMGLVDRDRAGRPLQYRLRLQREGRLLNPNERVGDALRPDDEVIIAPRIDAGRAVRA